MGGSNALASTPGAVNTNGRLAIDASATTAMDKNYTITNTGSNAVHLGVVSLDGAGASFFAIMNDTCSLKDLNPAATCGIHLSYRYDPAATGRARLTLPVDGEDLPIAVVGWKEGDEGLLLSAPLPEATTTASGDKIIVIHGATMANPAGNEEQFHVTVDGIPRALTAVALNPANPRLIELTLETLVDFGQTVRLSYAAGDVQSLAGALVPTYSDRLVVNAIPRLPGDVNNDRQVDLTDAILCLRLVAGKSMAGTPVRLVGDVNNNGRIGAEEAAFVLRGLSGLR